MIILLQVIGAGVIYTYVMGFLIWIMGNRGWTFEDFLGSPVLVPSLMIQNRTWFL